MIDPVPGVNVADLGGAGSAAAARADRAAEAPEGFGDSITGALDQLGTAEATADAAAVAGATGELQSVSDYMMAATEAQLAAEITVAVRNRAIESFNDIMSMQV